MTALDLEKARTVRIGAVEIGAGSVRFVALEVGVDDYFKIVGSDHCLVDLQWRSGDIDAAEFAARTAAEYERQCAHLYCEEIVTFITAPWRRWTDPVERCFRKHIPRLITLTPQEEAGFALLGSTIQLSHKISGDSFCVLDVGRGSIQLARGRYVGKSAESVESQSWPAGTQVARDVLQRAQHDIVVAFDELRKLIHSAELQIKPNEPVIALGSCVTNLARITHLPELRRPRMAKIHGLEVTTHDIARLVLLQQRDSGNFNQLVEGNGAFADRDTTLAGLLTLACVCEIARINKFTISTYGTRFGLAISRAKQVHSASSERPI